MKAVILAAGKSTRTQPLTCNCPKPLLPILGKKLAHYTLDALNGSIDEAIFVIGFMGDKIKEELGSSYNGIKLSYVEQKEQLGTGHALMQAKELLRGCSKFIVINGDDIYPKEAVNKLCQKECSIMAQKVKDVRPFGAIVLEQGHVKEIVEKPAKHVTDLANIGCYVFPEKVLEMNIEKTEREEFEITDFVTALAKTEKIEPVVTEEWRGMSYPWSYLEANVFMLSKLNEQEIHGIVEKNVHIEGPIYIGKNTVIKSGAYIEGPVYIGENCEIGPNAHIRKDTILMNNVRFGGEIIDSVMMPGADAKHQCYLGHSVIGPKSNIGAGTIVADWRHDGKDHMTVIHGKKVMTGRRKLGTFMGENVRTGIGTLIYPGRKMWPNTMSLPGQVVDKDVM